MINYTDMARSPWGLLDEMIGLSRSLQGVGDPWSGTTGRFPRVNAWEGDKGLIIEAELPGVSPDDIDVSVEGGELVLRGKRTLPGHSAEDARVFERSFELPFDVDTQAVQAKYRNGILTLTLPKAAAAQRRKIAVHAA